MRRSYSTVTPPVVRATAAAGLRAALPWQPFRSVVTVAALLDLILLVAAVRSSLAAIVDRCHFGFSHETARRALQANWPSPDALADGASLRHRNQLPTEESGP